MHPQGINRFGKKLYAIVTIIVIAVIAIALLIPQGAGIIPLSVEYTVGEKMIYNTTETASIHSGFQPLNKGAIVSTQHQRTQKHH